MKKAVKNPFLRLDLFLLLIGLFLTAGNGLAEWIASSSPYAAFLSDANVLIDVPALRQYGDYTCGATCVQMLMNWLYPYEADLNLTAYEELLGTTPENGTSPDAILRYFEESGVEFAALHSLTLDDLRQKLDADHPVLLPLQAWSSAEDGSYQLDDPSDSETYLAEGHWVICVGYGQRGKQAYFLFNDPACVGHDLIDADEFDRRWIDKDGAGTVYDHFGIEILQSTDYDPNGLFYME